MVDTAMSVEDIGDELADLDALEESLTGGVPPGAVDASAGDTPDTEKKSMGAKAAEYSVDAISDLEDLDALEQSLAVKSSEPEPEPEPKPEPQAEVDTALQSSETSSRTDRAKHLTQCCNREWWGEELHPAKREELAHVFAYFDTDGNGTIDRHELRAVISDLCAGGHVRHPTDEIVDEMMQLGDKDGDGLIDFNEFVELVTTADLDLHPSLCSRCQNRRRDRRCFLRKKPGVRCGPPADKNFDPHSLPHPAFWVLAKSILVHTAVGIALLMLAVGADGDVKMSSGLSALLIVLAAFGLTLTYAGVPASRGWFGLYLVILITQVSISNAMLMPYIYDETCDINGVEIHEACAAMIEGAELLYQAKDACIAAQNDLGQSYCTFKTDCDLSTKEHSCKSTMSEYEERVCTWHVVGSRTFCNATSTDARLSAVGGTCLSSVACRFRTLLTYLSVIYTVVVATAIIAVVLVLVDSLGPHPLSFSNGQQSPWEQALMMSMDVGLHHKQKKGLVSSEYGTSQRSSKFSPQLYGDDDPSPPEKPTLASSLQRLLSGWESPYTVANPAIASSKRSPSTRRRPLRASLTRGSARSYVPMLE